MADERELLRDLLKRADLDGGRSISRHVLRLLLERVTPLKPADIDLIFDQLDVNCDGKLCCEEFIGYVMADGQKSIKDRESDVKPKRTVILYEVSEGMDVIVGRGPDEGKRGQAVEISGSGADGKRYRVKLLDNKFTWTTQVRRFCNDKELKAVKQSIEHVDTAITTDDKAHSAMGFDALSQHLVNEAKQILATSKDHEAGNIELFSLSLGRLVANHIWPSEVKDNERLRLPWVRALGAYEPSMRRAVIKNALTKSDIIDKIVNEVSATVAEFCCREVETNEDLKAKIKRLSLGLWGMGTRASAQADRVPEGIRVFYEAAVSSPPYADRGPEWTGTLRLEQFVTIASKLLPDLQAGELQRIFDSMGHDDHETGTSTVDLKTFSRAVRSGSAQFVLSSIVERFNKSSTGEFEVSDNFDYSKSTNDNYGTNFDPNSVTEKYKDLRCGMDYSYHVGYTVERQRWQDQMIDSIIIRTTPQAQPWLVYTCGPMGVGKGYALAWMSKLGFFPLENIVHVDPDAFKTMMPEWSGYVDYDGDDAGTKCHMESCCMMEIAQAAAMKQKQNIWIDGSLRNAEFYREQFQSIRESAPHYRIAIFYVEASEFVIRERIKERAEKTGRNVPEHLIQASLQAMDHSLNVLTPLCDFVARINNEGLQPTLRAFETIDSSGVWAVIKDNFAKLANQSTKFPHALPPMSLEPMPPELIAKMIVSAEKRVLTIDLADGSDKILQQLVALFGRYVELPASCEHVVTLPQCVRKTLSIPSDASKFFWIYGSNRFDKAVLVAHGFTAEDQQRDVIRFVRTGGFCYLNVRGEVVGLRLDLIKSQIQALQFDSAVPQALQFDSAVPVPGEVFKHLPMSRFHEATSSFSRSRGTDSYAWYPPGEQVQGVNLGGKHGAFVYVLKDGEGALSAVAFRVIA